MSFVSLTPILDPTNYATALNEANLLAPQTLETPPIEQGTLKGRTCLHWRMAPGVLALAGLVVAIVHALMSQNPYLCAVYGPGGVCSIYLIYLGYNFQNLKSFTENNDQLQFSVTTLKAENQELHQSIEGLNGSLSELHTENGTLKETNAQLSSSMQDLQTQILELKKLKNIIEQKTSLHMSQLQGLNESLSQMQNSAAEDHSTFALHLKTFIDQVQQLETTKATFEAAESKIEEEMQKQCTTLLESASMLQNIFTEIQTWKDTKEVKTRLNLQRDLQKQILDLQLQIGQSTGLLEQQKKQLEELAKVKEGFNQLLQELLEAAANLQSHNGQLANEVKKVANTFKNYELGEKN